MKIRTLGFAALTITAMLFACETAPAFAQALAPAQPGRGIDFGPFALNIIDVLAMVATVAAGILSKFAISFLASKTKMTDNQFQALAADRVNDILHRAIEYAEAWAKTQVADPTSQIRNVQIDNFFLATAVNAAKGLMPDLINYFGLTEDKLKVMILARLNGYIKTPEVNSGVLEMTTSTTPSGSGQSAPATASPA